MPRARGEQGVTAREVAGGDAAQVDSHPRDGGHLGVRDAERLQAADGGGGGGLPLGSLELDVVADGDAPRLEGAGRDRASAPFIVKTRSTHSRTRPVVTRLGQAHAELVEGGAQVVQSLPGDGGDGDERHVAEALPRTCRAASAGSARSARETATTTCSIPSARTAAERSVDWRRHPSSAATTNRTPGAGPSPASMVAMNRW